MHLVRHVIDFVTSVAQCIAEQKRMVILFYDWTIEDFPNLLHAPFIYFPLWQPWFLKMPKGWGWYKHLTWVVTHNQFCNKIFNILGFKKGWDLTHDSRYLEQTKKSLQHIFRPKKEIVEKSQAIISHMRESSDLIIGIHIRHGDYKDFHGGRYFYTLDEYHQFMLRLKQLYSDKRVSFFISSNVEFPVDSFVGCKCYRFEKENSADILDLYTLSLCDRILGPWSSYSRWASFIGEVPLCYIKNKEQDFTDDSFSRIVDFFHFESGENTVEYWVKGL